MNTPRQFHHDQLVIASHNQDKIDEITSLLRPFHIVCESARSLNLIVPDEDGSTYLENARIKAEAACRATGLPALGDDSGIEVDALFGEPGLHTAPFTKAHGGREAVFALWAASPQIAKNPRAHFICVLVLFWPDGHYEYFTGKVSGNLQFPPRGNGGHGYDPVFIPDGYTKTAAEMSLLEKNRCSHRYLALQRLIDGCMNKKTQ